MLPVPAADAGALVAVDRPGDAGRRGVARPLVEGLGAETVVRDPSGARLFDIEPAAVRGDGARGAARARRRNRHVASSRRGSTSSSAASGSTCRPRRHSRSTATPEPRGDHAAVAGLPRRTPGPIEMRAGTLIEYRLKLHGMPGGWRTRIEAWEPPLRFVDVQLSGPYALWEHTQVFTPRGEGASRSATASATRYRSVRSARWPTRSFVRRDFERIFDHRARRRRRAPPA